MARKIRDEVITDILQRSEKKYGKAALYRSGNMPDLPRVSTGLPELDAVIGGGLVPGRMYELFGPESAGKSSLALHIMAQFPQALMIDCEHTYTEAFGAVFGNKEENVYLMRPEYGEDAFDVMNEFATNGIPVIVVDSVPALNPKKSAERAAAEADTQAALAQLLGRQLRRLVPVIGKSETIVIFINQVRDKFGTFFGDPFDTPGGHALKHAASLRLQCGRKEWLKDEKLAEFGILSKVRVVKSKIANPRGVVELPLIFKRGFVRHEDIERIQNELRIAEGFRAKRVAGKKADDTPLPEAS